MLTILSTTSQFEYTKIDVCIGAYSASLQQKKRLFVKIRLLSSDDSFLNFLTKVVKKFRCRGFEGATALHDGTKSWIAVDIKVSQYVHKVVQPIQWL